MILTNKYKRPERAADLWPTEHTDRLNYFDKTVSEREYI